MLMENDQTKLWDAISFLAENNKVQEAKSVMKVLFSEIFSVFLGAEFVPSHLEIKEITPEDIEHFKILTSKMSEYEKEGYHLSANELLVEFIQSSTLNNREVLASLLLNRFPAIHEKQRNEISQREEDTEEMEEGYFKAGYAAKRLGVTTQTLRRYCEAGRIPGAKKTPGGHWRIPKTAFRVSEQQVENSKETLKKIDVINCSYGEVEDEFRL